MAVAWQLCSRTKQTRRCVAVRFQCCVFPTSHCIARAGTLLAALNPGAPVDVTISNGAPTTIYFLPRFKNIAAMTVSSVRVGVSTVSSKLDNDVLFLLTS